jgi:hypothetical protein
MSEWRKPTADEQARGFVAMLPMTFYCQTDRGMLAIDYTGGYTDKETKVSYPRKTAWQGYTQAQLERRAKRGTDVPTWFVAPKQESDWSAEFLEYVTGAEPSESVRRKLEELGSYAA